MSKIQVPGGKVINKVPDKMLQKLFEDNRVYLPVANMGSPRKSPSYMQVL